jgi:hypothetical protein
MHLVVVEARAEDLTPIGIAHVRADVEHVLHGRVDQRDAALYRGANALAIEGEFSRSVRADGTTGMGPGVGMVGGTADIACVAC